MNKNCVSVAVVKTPRAPRYGRQLVTHFGHKTDSRWDETSERGHVHFGHDGSMPEAHADFICDDTALTVRLEASDEHVARYEAVISDHLERFAARDGLVARWRREETR